MVKYKPTISNWQLRFELLIYIHIKSDGANVMPYILAY